MQDSQITYRFKADGIEEIRREAERLDVTLTSMTRTANGTYTASGKLTASLDEQAAATSRAGNATSKASKAQEGYFTHIAKTTVQSALINKAFLGMVDSAGAAVKQVDLFASFPASMAALGLSSTDASEALKSLQGYVQSVGGDLTKAASTVGRFAGVTKNVKAAVAEYAGLNNALIAGGANTEVQASALEQLTQAYSRGHPQLIEWKSALVAMQPQLEQVAKKMGFVNAGALGDELTKGKISMQEFMTQLTELSTGTGPIAKQAIARMNGIEFAGNVMKNALTNGLAAIYQAVGRENIIAFFGFLTQVIMVLAQSIVYLINLLFSLFNLISKVFGGPQIKHFSGDAAGAADALGTGASNAGDLADNLDDGADAAKKMNKQLAAFDKMNVLTQPNDKNKDTGPGTGLSPADAAALNGIFDNLLPKMGEIGTAAKVFAGILGGLAALKFAKSIIDQFNSISKSVQDAKSNLDKIKDALKGTSSEADKTGKSMGEKLAANIGKGATNLSSAIIGLVAGAAGRLGAAIAPLIATVGAAIVDALWTYILVPLGAVLGSLAAIFGIPIWAVVAIIAVIVAVIVGIIWLIWKNWDTILNALQTALSATVNFFIAVWNTLYDIFAGPIKFLWQVFSSIFILIVAIVATTLEIIFKLWVGAWMLIFNFLLTISTWIYDNVIKPIIDLFIAMWKLQIELVTATWEFIFNNILKPIATWVYNNVILPIVNFFKGMWDLIAGFTVGFATSIYNVLRPIVDWIYQNIILPIGRFFSSLWDGIKTGLSNMLDALKNIFNGITGIFKTPINGIIDLLNSVLANLNKTVKVPSWVPGLGGKGTNFPMIPKLARGGIATRSTLANIGEAGAEAIVPLENNTEWIDKLAAKISTSNGGAPMQLTVKIGEDTIVSKVIELINEKTQMSGQNVILV